MNPMNGRRLEISKADGTVLEGIVIQPNGERVKVLDGGDLMGNGTYFLNQKLFEKLVRKRAQRKYNEKIIGLEYKEENKEESYLTKLFSI